MSSGIYLDDDEDRLGAVADALLSINPIDQATIEMAELPVEERDRIQKMQDAGAVLGEIPVPHLFDRLDPSKVTEAPGIHAKVSQAAASTGLSAAPIQLDSILNMHIPGTPSTSREEIRMRRLQTDLEENKEEVENYIQVAKNALEDELPIPLTDDQIIASLNETIEEVVENAAPHIPFPNLAREIMKLGIGMEKYQTEEKLAKYKKEGDEHKAVIDKLLAMSAQLPRINSDDGSYTLKDDAKVAITKLAAELKEKGVDIFPGLELGDEITKEQLAAANSLINHHIDQNRTKLQELFTTKISVSIQFLQMMNEVMKKISELDDRVKRKPIEAPRS